MRRLAVLLAFLVFVPAALGDDAARYRVVTVQSLDGPLAVVEDLGAGTTAFLPADESRAWRVLGDDLLVTYANGEPLTAVQFHPPFDAWTWLDYWYGFAHAEVQAALAAPTSATDTAPAFPPLAVPTLEPDLYDAYGSGLADAVAAEPFRFAYVPGAVVGLPLWDVEVGRTAPSVDVEYTAARAGPDVVVETLPRALYPLRAWPRARRLVRTHGIEFRVADGQLFGRTRSDWIVVHGLATAQRVRVARAIRFR